MTLCNKKQVQLNLMTCLATSFSLPPKATTVLTELSASSAAEPALAYADSSFSVSVVCDLEIRPADMANT